MIIINFSTAISNPCISITIISKRILFSTTAHTLIFSENKKLKSEYICYIAEKSYRLLGIAAAKILRGGCGYPVYLST
jgi:hypothetical protein